MGSVQSASNSISNQTMTMFSSLSKNVIVDTSFHDFFDNPISDDLLIEILSFVPEKDLILNCQLVCKYWHELISGQSIWRRKCERENIKLPNFSHKFSILPSHHFRYLYLYSKAEKNLLRNPCGEDGLSKWEIHQSAGDGFVTEKPPAGCDPVPAEVGSESCFATSYGYCLKSQVIDLYKKEYNKYLLQNKLATIKIGEWYGARFDCGCIYELKVELLNDTSEPIENFMFNSQCNQWDGGQWHFIDHEFTDVRNVRYIHFEHMGKDTQFWAGHYGSKFTGAFVKLSLPQS